MTETMIAPWAGGKHLGKVADLLEPRFKNAGKVHDWPNHVGDAVEAIWETLTLEQLAAVAIEASNRASNEEWE